VVILSICAVCCIYHKSRGFGESDSEQESTDDDSSDDGENSYERDRKRRPKKGTCFRRWTKSLTWGLYL